MTPEGRRALMARIRNRGTAPERAVVAVLRSLGWQPRMNDARLPGTPDAVVVRRRTVVFVHGCFWHRHRRCKRAFTPAKNAARWLEKFTRNIRRDRRVAKALRRAGWSVLTVWECQTIARRLPSLRLRLHSLITRRLEIRTR